MRKAFPCHDVIGGWGRGGNGGRGGNHKRGGGQSQTYDAFWGMLRCLYGTRTPIPRRKFELKFELDEDLVFHFLHYTILHMIWQRCAFVPCAKICDNVIIRNGTTTDQVIPLKIGNKFILMDPKPRGFINQASLDLLAKPTIWIR